MAAQVFPTHLLLQLLLLCSILAPTASFRLSTPTHNRASPLFLSTMTGGDDNLLARIAAKFKVVPYAAASDQPRVSLECKDPQFRDVDSSVVLSRVGGMGLDLVECDKLEVKGRYGLVLVGGVNPGSNAERPVSGEFLLGDSLLSVGGVRGGKVENKVCTYPSPGLNPNPNHRPSHSHKPT